MVCIWVLGFYQLDNLRVLMGYLKFCSPDCGEVIVLLWGSCLCLFDAIVEFFSMSEKKMFNDFLIGERKWILYAIKTYTINDLYFVYVVEASITLNCKA